MQGFLVIDKPAGLTSHDVVRRVRKATGIRRVGHAGTLDPLATGLLPVAIGDATRLIEYFSEREKGYSASMLLGSETDTQDSEGEVLARGDWHPVDAVQVEAVLAHFRGEIDQMPPMYSALKKDGVPLYRLARQGVVIERPARRLTIHSLDLTRFAPPEISFDVVCSKGTYVRTLCHDIGRELGCFAHMTGLRRFRHGQFDLSMAVALDDIIKLDAAGIQERLLSPLAALSGLAQFSLTEQAYQRLLNGIPPVIDELQPDPGPCADGDLVCLVQDNRLLAMARFEPLRLHEKRGDFVLQKVFLDRGA